MIGRIWIKLFLMVLLVVLPLMAAQYWMQKESIILVSGLAEKSNAAGFIDSYLESLKRLSKYDPANSPRYRSEFEHAAEVRGVIQDMGLVRRNLIDDILTQALRNTLIVLLVALAATYWIARSIVALLRRLIEENRTHSLRLERLSALESWQKVARMMVHEMRAPVTPIKLVATDIEAKYQSLNGVEFEQYLARGAELLRTQVTSIERLTENLTKFARLPDVQKTSGSIGEFVSRFVDSYRTYSDHVSWELEGMDDLSHTVAFDANLLNLLFFNLLKNAVEANPFRGTKITIQARQIDSRTWITFVNTGQPVPANLTSDIFKLHVSTKGTNFGVGLTIAKKIAFDHNGDLSLASNEPDRIAFELELPNR